MDNNQAKTHRTKGMDWWTKVDCIMKDNATITSLAVELSNQHTEQLQLDIVNPFNGIQHLISMTSEEATFDTAVE